MEFQKEIPTTENRLKVIAKRFSCKCPGPDTRPFLYVIFDGRKGVVEKLRGIIKAGVEVVQLRDKNLSARELVGLGYKVKKVIKNKALFFINDYLDIALAISADGVHLGTDDLPVGLARKIAGKKILIGLSTHDAREVRGAISKPVDYISFGPVFKTTTKINALSPRGIKRLREAVSYSRRPLVAIGGINRENLKDVLKAGVNGVAISSAILDASDTYRAALETRNIITTYNL